VFINRLRTLWIQLRRLCRLHLYPIHQHLSQQLHIVNKKEQKQAEKEQKQVEQEPLNSWLSFTLQKKSNEEPLI